MTRIQWLVLCAAIVIGGAGLVTARGARAEVRELEEQLANEHALGQATDVRATALRLEVVRLQAMCTK
jgi:hypothetical protein